MRRSGPWRNVRAAVVLGSLLGSGCNSSVEGRLGPMPAQEVVGVDPTPGAGGSGSSVEPPISGGTGGSAPEMERNFCGGVSNTCDPVESSEHLPGRVLPEVQTTVVETVTPSEIYEMFSAACGTCHRREPSDSNGNWSIRSASDVIKPEAQDGLGQQAIDRILTSDPEDVMPPRRGGASGVRPPDADTQLLLETLQAWVAAERPESGLSREKTAEPPFFRVSDEVRLSLTNIGSCLPSAETVGCAESRVEEMDLEFAAMRSFADLPDRLEQTDLFTFDAAELAQHRVIGYAPTYTLFSDGAKKMRHIRVPAGQTIRYNPATRDFDIPSDTRFYKTFLRKVIGMDGEVSYRKIETRIIVVRPDEVAADGARTRRVIFGTYLWSLDEARAELVTDPYNDQTPFKDLSLRHVIDERTADASGFDPDTEAGIDGALRADDARRLNNIHLKEDAETPERRPLTRGYALPGRDRCVQCHMGSRTGVWAENQSIPNASFILGFSPYQVDRRPEDEGGVFDGPVGPDELSQLQRFIAYGILTGVPLPVPGERNVFKLENSLEPDLEAGAEAASNVRYPRNAHELEAQGYMLGNCAFCHNPDGFPSVENPSLKEVLDFYPSLLTNGGIFRFPLDAFSPRTSRGVNFDARFYYISPSLFERGDGIGGGSTAKYFAGRNDTTVFVVAPWRSLLFRNVHTPFTYGHDGAIHPHMPLNVPGYDPRAPRIMADWMLSIPAKLKPGARNEQNYYGEPPNESDPIGTDQPWEEVTEDDPLFAEYQQVSDLRVQAFHRDSLWPYEEYAARCPSLVDADCRDAEAGKHAYIGAAAFPFDTSDVVAPEMRLPPQLEQPADEDLKIAQLVDDSGRPMGPAHITRTPTELSSQELAVAVGWNDDVPDRPSWIARDLTSRPGDWVPRRSNWAELLASEAAFVPGPLDLIDLPFESMLVVKEAHEQRRDAARRLHPVLSSFRIGDELRRFSLSTESKFYYGLWEAPKLNQTVAGEGERCQAALAGAQRVKNLSQEQAPLWLRQRRASLSGQPKAELEERLVYEQPPGEVFFTLICSNCHGREADSNSLLGTTMLELTGGRTRVANLRDGLFGNEGANRAAVFPGAEFPNETTETMAVRYLVWMGLGGTEATIPQVVLSRVGATRPLGVDRVENPSVQATANMLSNAVGFCQATLAIGGAPGLYLGFDHPSVGPGVPQFDAARSGGKGEVGLVESPLVASNGDAELWLRVCALDNPPPIRVVELGPCKDLTDIRCKAGDPRFVITGAYWPDVDGTRLFPEGARVGDHLGQTRDELRPDNLLPWCVKRPADDESVARLESLWRSGNAPPPEDAPPYCPESLFEGYSNDRLSLDIDWLQVQPLGTADSRRDAWATRGAMNVGASVFLYLDALARGELARKPPHDACQLPGAVH